MTNEEAIIILERDRDILGHYGGESAEALGMAIKALEQQPCENCVSREAVLNLFNKSDEYRWETAWIRRKIEKLPSVTPTRSKGRWIEQKDIHKHHYGWSFCSECGAFLMSSDGANFCSCCGSKMEVDE